MIERIELQQRTAGTSEHPAVLAWRRLNAGAADPGEISMIKKRFKSTIYRIENLGPGATSIVAKCCQRKVAAHERVIYEDILPNLPVSFPRYYGSVRGEGDYDWLFLECVEGERYCRERQDHSVLAGKWLGDLHSSGESVAASRAWLPDLGPGHYLVKLRTARARLQGNLKHPNLAQEDRTVVQTAILQCDFLESHWDQIERWCGRMPRTFLHGDFKPRNVVIRSAPDGPTLFTFDWEESGWGVPAEDIAYIDLRAYHAVTRYRWPDMSMRDLQQMKIVGRIFRGLSEFCWESVKLDPNWEVSVVTLRIYEQGMAEGIHMAQWGE